MKIFLLDMIFEEETIYLYCILNKLSCKAAAPTGRLDAAIDAPLPVTYALGPAGSCAPLLCL